MHDGGRLVLIVDDDRAVRDSLKFALDLEGLDTRVFSNGRDLLADPLLRQAGCVILDHDMPDLDGFEVLAKLKALHYAMPIILMTDRSSDMLRRRASAAGLRYVVEKPLLNGTLIDSIHDALRVHP